MAYEIRIKDIERLPEAAAQFVEMFRPDKTGKTIFAFHAPMGAGKTTFISAVCRILGSEDEPGSPTFSIVNEYDTEKWGKVYHLDCYRIEGEEEAFETGVEDYFDSGRVCFVEWPEKIGSLLPEDAVRVEISVEEDGSRKMSFRNGDSLD